VGTELYTGMYVKSDGTVYTNSEWDEGAREAGIYKDGNVIRAIVNCMVGKRRRVAVTASSDYLYVSMQGEGGKEGEDYPHLRQPGMPSDATPYLSTCSL